MHPDEPTTELLLLHTLRALSTCTTNNQEFRRGGCEVNVKLFRADHMRVQQDFTTLEVKPFNK